MTAIFQKILFRLRLHANPVSALRKAWWRLQGASIGAGTIVPRVLMTWPHQVRIGRRCLLEDGIFFKYDGFWRSGPSIILKDRVFVGKDCEFNIRKRITIGDDCLIASGCKFIDHDHALTVGEGPMNSLPCPDAEITLEEDVWLGVNVVVLKGVTIGHGAVVGAGAIVTKSIAPYEIWAGVPARRIGDRRSRDRACEAVVGA